MGSVSLADWRRVHYGQQQRVKCREGSFHLVSLQWTEQPLHEDPAVTCDRLVAHSGLRLAAVAELTIEQFIFKLGTASLRSPARPASAELSDSAETRNNRSLSS